MDLKQATAISSVVEELRELTNSLTSILGDNSIGAALPSYDQSSDLKNSSPASEDKLTKTRFQIADAARKLTSLALGSRESLLRSTFSHHDSLSLAIISRYSIARAVPPEGAISILELSKKVELSEFLTRSILRHAIASGIFQETTPEHVEHNEISRLLLEPTMDAWVAHSVDEVFPALPAVLDSWRKFPAADEPDESAFSLTVGEGKNLFEYFGSNSIARDRFSLAMSGLTAGGEYAIQHLVKGYSWSTLQDKSVVVDVGGSDGAVARAIANENPNISLIVQDLEGVVEQGKASLPASLRDQVTFQAHNFFSPQPLKADVYILRHVLHDWPDKYCIQILQLLISSIKPSSKILVNDAIMIQPTETSKEQYWMMSAMNLQMMTLLNAKERTLQDWKDLFTKADPRLRITSVTTPIGSQMSIIELAICD
ncbi:O-methyltransferase-domain-containing protein [Bisporella sp. PMI_857]|nr:O-methyltransferase-domain-containing protein [Bisporella sp. PMI_857]